MSTNTYYLACKLKKAWVFAILIKILKFQVLKKAKLETGFKNIIQKNIMIY